MNIVNLVGRLGADPDVKFLQNGTAVANFSMCTTENFRNKAGEKQEVVDWHRIVVFGKQAERIGEYLGKGRLVSVSGSLKPREYTVDGKKHYIVEVKATSVQFLDFAKDAGKSTPKTDAPLPVAPEGEQVDEDQIPF